jgi:all-trans-retinol 13,14-reductase
MIRWLIGGLVACITLGVALSFSWGPGELQHMSSWHVKVDPTTKKAKNEYDVIVVGGGFGGLSCGAFLAKNGYKVLVLEKNQTVGGLCTSYVDNGYRFCYGAQDIGGLAEIGPISFLLKQLGLKKEEFFTPNTHGFFDGTNLINVPAGPNSFEQAMLQAFPKETDAIHRFFTKAKSVLEEGADPEMLQKWGIILPSELVAKVMPEAWVKNYAATHKNLLEWSEKPYQDVLDEYFTNPDLKVILSAPVSYLGSLPYNTPANAVMLGIFGAYLNGSYQPLGTAQKFAEVLASYISAHGGTVMCSQPVKKIMVDKAGVKGVEAGGLVYKAPVVVSNVNAKSAYFKLLDRDDLPQDFLKDLWSLPLGNSAFCIHLAVDHPLPGYPSIVQDRYSHVYIAIPSKNDPSTAPQGKSAVILREKVRFTSFIQNTPEETEKYVKEQAADLLARGTQIIPELAKGTVVERVVTPSTFADLADVPYGAIFGFDTSRSSLRPYFRSPIRGLYMANASSSGPGVPTVISEGILCAHDIMGWGQQLQSE